MKTKRIYHILILVCGTAFFTTGCTNFFFQPDHIGYSTPATWNKRARIVQITTKDGTKLIHWFFPSSNPKGTVFFLHGNAQNVSSHVRSVAWLADHGYNVLLFEYRGFGQNPGEPDLKETMEDIVTTFRNIQTIPGIAEKPVVLFGQSLGASIALYIATIKNIKRHLCAVIAESPFSDYQTIVKEKLSSHWLTRLFQYPLLLTINDAYSPEKRVDNITPVHLLIIHSKNDKIIPIHHSLTLYKKAKQPKEFWEITGRHITFLKSKDGQKRFLTYLTTVCTQ